MADSWHLRTTGSAPATAQKQSQRFWCRRLTGSALYVPRWTLACKSRRFPSATLQVMRPERTFWEKATAIHVFCAQGSFRGGARFACHWHYVTRLDAAGFADGAAKDRALAAAVAKHRSIFFAESTPDGEPVDYRAAVTGELDLAPSGDARKTLAEDYQRLVSDGLLLDDAESLDFLLERCQALAERVNAIARARPPETQSARHATRIHASDVGGCVGACGHPRREGSRGGSTGHAIKAHRSFDDAFLVDVQGMRGSYALDAVELKDPSG
ncbi:MAG: nucleotidyl transferase AbiEii/AbiGii toxin family protein [Burkholderiales bacterium]|nr:nucleotidyl transferase AbiEii/AbiGii toxin family protein [Burkholderiales bacterium]